MEAVLGFLQQGTHEQPVSLQARVNGLDENYELNHTDSTFLVAPKFYLIVNDANNQPIADLDATKVQIQSSNGFFKLASPNGFADGDPGDGVYTINLVGGDSLPETLDLGQELIDEISITVTSEDEVTTLTRSINLRVVEIPSSNDANE